MFHILIAEDDFHTRKLMEAVIRHAGYMTLTAANGLDALNILDKNHVDLIVMDVMMPSMNGYELTKILRDCHSDIPILMVSAKQLPEDKRKAFLAGTDDYMTKPVDEEEMLLRIRALLRRTNQAFEHKLTVGQVTLDYNSFTVTRNGDVQTLPQKEFLLLYKLLSYPGKIFTRLELMDEIWGMDSETTEATINVHINRLRKRFENYPEFELATVRGLGYKAVKNKELQP